MNIVIPPYMTKKSPHKLQVYKISKLPLLSQSNSRSSDRIVHYEGHADFILILATEMQVL